MIYRLPARDSIESGKKQDFGNKLKKMKGL